MYCISEMSFGRYSTTRETVFVLARLREFSLYKLYDELREDEEYVVKRSYIFFSF